MFRPKALQNEQKPVIRVPGSVFIKSTRQGNGGTPSWESLLQFPVVLMLAPVQVPCHWNPWRLTLHRKWSARLHVYGGSAASGPPGGIILSSQIFEALTLSFQLCHESRQSP